MANKRICVVDQKEYEYCPVCSNTRPTAEDSWKLMYCSENCRDIFHTVGQYNLKEIDTIQANEILSGYDLSEYDKFPPGLKKDIATIKKEAATVPAPEPVAQPVAETKVETQKSYDSDRNKNYYNKKKKYY